MDGLEQGAKEAIIGPNGAGKSTFFALVSGYHRPDTGSIRFDGKEITGQKPHEIARRGISRAFQVSNIFPRLTVEENVRSAIQVRSGKAFDLFSRADRVGLERTEEILSLCNLSPKRSRPAGELSQGDKKKVELALALAGQPKLLLLYEPTAGMSFEETKETMELVDRLNATFGLTILFTEHDMSSGIVSVVQAGAVPYDRQRCLEKAADLAADAARQGARLVVFPGELVAKHRKLMPTAMERLIWGFGDGSTLPVVDTARKIRSRCGGPLCSPGHIQALRQRTSTNGSCFQLRRSPGPIC